VRISCVEVEKCLEREGLDLLLVGFYCGELSLKKVGFWGVDFDYFSYE
jgi:hypothetical protein